MHRRSTLSGLMLAGALFFPGAGHAAAAMSALPHQSESPVSMKAADPAACAGTAFCGRPGGGVVRAPRRPHAGPNRLGDRECCKTPDCRCGCLYSLVGAAVAALRA